jgi:hypothetical protein
VKKNLAQTQALPPLAPAPRAAAVGRPTLATSEATPVTIQHGVLIHADSSTYFPGISNSRRVFRSARYMSQHTRLVDLSSSSMMLSPATWPAASESFHNLLLKEECHVQHTAYFTISLPK